MAGDLDEAVDRLARECLSGYGPHVAKRPKAIHEALWGTHVFTAGEIDVLDCPLIQRLRGVRQTAFACLTFPSATHSRFEHSLGVAVVATRMADALNRKRGQLIKPVELQELRLAGLLHDCGHGFLSHISEEFYGRHPWIRELKEDPYYQAAKPSELLAYKIILSGPFGEYFERVRGHHLDDQVLQSVDLRKIAGFVIGQGPSPESQFLASIINGPFDADKLDYIARDSYFTGLRLVVDIDRLLYALDVADVPREEGGSERRLVIYATGSSAFEQVLYSKVQLHALMYKHPKVRAADLMLISFLSYMKQQMPGELLERFGECVRLEEPTDFLRFADYDLLNDKLHQDDYLRGIILDLRNRRLMRKALVISSNTVEENLDELTRLLEHPYREQILAGLREQIHGDLAASLGLRVYDVVVDLPPTPQLNEAALSVVRQPNGELVPLNRLFPSHDWLDAFVARKWRGHVFCRGGADTQRSVGLAAKGVLESAPFNLVFNNLALDLALGEQPTP
jgi:HD superfamily phosphohydrolase